MRTDAGRSCRRASHRAPRVMTTTLVAASPRPAPTARACTSRIPAASSSGTRDGSSASALAPTRATSWAPGRISPRHQPTSRGSGATARAVTTSTAPTASATDAFLGPPPHHPPAQARPVRRGQRRLRPGTPRGAAIGSSRTSSRSGRAHRQRDARETGAAAHVDDAGTVRDHLGHHRTVEQVPLPQPRHLPRTDEAPGHPVGGEHGGRTPWPPRAGRRTPRRPTLGGGGRPPSPAPL